MIADKVTRAVGLRAARKLAMRLLHDSSEPSDAQVVNAFRSYLHLLEAGDKQAIEVSQQLSHWHQSPHCAPYFLELLQAQANRDERKRSGAYYTPWPIAQWIVSRVEQLVPADPLRIVDPACGGGVFLLAAADLAARRPGSNLIGYDTSAAAIAVTGELLCGPRVSATLQQINPLLAGCELQSQLLPGSGTLVILGNPPYANFGRRNRGPWIDELVADYRQGLDEQKLNLTDDFIKFLRWGQHWIDQASQGVLAMITSRTYLSGLTHRGMRRSLALSFPHIEIVDLHGDGEPGDANVFGIRRGVAVGVFSKQCDSGSGSIHYHSVAGARTKKLKWLNRPVPARAGFVARPPDWMFVPAPPHTRQAANDYMSWTRLDEIFSEFISGVQTKNDALFVDFDRDALAARMKQHLTLRGETFDARAVRPYVVGPFDRRWIYYDPRLLGRARWQVMRHIAQVEPNLALVFMRQSTSRATYDHALVVDALASDRVFYSRRGAPFVAPLWRSSVNGCRLGNLSEPWTDTVADRLGFRPDEPALFAYLYAILHAPTYRRDYLTQLKRSFPRIPWPRSSEFFAKLVELGARLIACHLTECSDQALQLVGETDDRTILRGYPRFHGDTVQINSTASLRLPEPKAWEFHVGGYPVMERWLKARRGRALSLADMGHLARLCTIASKTQQLVYEIETVMERQ